jgi:CRP/FNR family transcriptional regulator, anaerobic regulatory protein
VSKLLDNMQVSCNNCSLDTICLPRGLSEQEINSLSEVVKRKRTLQRGDYIYREGSPFKGILAVKSGTAKLVKDDPYGNEHIVNILLPGELLGFDGLHENRHSCSAVALETMSFCELPNDKLESLCLQTPGLMRELFRHTGEKLNEEMNWLVLHKRPAEERLASFLISLSERFKRRGFSPCEFTLTLTRQEIGNHLGLALETVSRLLQQFQSSGLISVHNKRIHIHNLNGLRALYSEVA